VTDYPHLPADCRKGRCTHARQNLLCAVNYPTDTKSCGQSI